MRLAAAMIVGKGEGQRHLKRAFDGAQQWADVVIVYGDGVDPLTSSMILRPNVITALCPVSMYADGEHLVRNQLFELCDQTLDPGDIVVVVDADEVVHGNPELIRRSLLTAGSTQANSWAAQFFHLWSPDGKFHRVDGMWQPSVGVRVYRHQPGLRVQSLGRWVCPPIPADLMNSAPAEPVIAIDHWGYARAQDRPRKYELYRKLEGHHPRHIQSIIEEPALEPVPA